MSYQCRDCSFSRRGPFANGCCPACGSYNISHQGEGETPDAASAATGKRLRPLILAVLWIILAYLIYQKI